MIVLWYPTRSPGLSRYEMDMTFHHVDSISAATKHTLLLRPSGSYEYSLQQRMLKRLEFPYDTNCVDYAKLDKLAHYPAYHTQEVTQILALVGGYLGIWLGLSLRTFAIILIDWCFERLRRLQRSKYAAAEVSSVARFLRLVVGIASLVLCVRNSLEDVHHYWRFPAAVVYNEDQDVRFPVLTLCFPDGWKVAYTYVLHTVCYSMDFDLAAELKEAETAFAECPEPWKY
ncbi:hypothetical protein V5799_008002, partial [Amblyomma americanum]